MSSSRSCCSRTTLPADAPRAIRSSYLASPSTSPTTPWSGQPKSQAAIQSEEDASRQVSSRARQGRHPDATHLGHVLLGQGRDVDVVPRPLAPPRGRGHGEVDIARVVVGDGQPVHDRCCHVGQRHRRPLAHQDAARPGQVGVLARQLAGLAVDAPHRAGEFTVGDGRAQPSVAPALLAKLGDRAQQVVVHRASAPDAALRWGAFNSRTTNGQHRLRFFLGAFTRWGEAPPCRETGRWW